MDRESIASEITAALRAHDKPRLSILRQVKNEIDIKEKEARRDATPAEVVAELKKVLKQTRETSRDRSRPARTRPGQRCSPSRWRSLRDTFPRR